MTKRSDKTEMIHARIDPRLKKSAQRIFTEVGISTTEAIRLFLRQVELHRGLPFPVTIPNEETVAAMMETNGPSELKSYGSFRELRNRI
jgi:DNA-damage-inducible protein J